MKQMPIKGITKRWVTNTLGAIVVILSVISIAASVGLRNYYYGTVRHTLNSSASSIVTNFFNLYTGGTSDKFEAGARDFVESFTDKDKMEVWVIDKSGDIIISSSGFQEESKTQMPDYEEAIESESGRGEWIGRLPSGEKVMAVTSIIADSKGSQEGAVRYIASLSLVDRQLMAIIATIAIVALAAVFMVILSSAYFIRSIVNPVHEINEVAKKMAQGDFNARINKHFDDEIGELCDTINYMAEEIGTTDKMKNDFLSTVSHELRTPLTAIKGWGETLVEIGDSDPTLTQKGMQVIISEAGRLSGIVEDLLDFSHMQSGRMNLKIGKIDILAELDEAAFVFRERARREGIELVYNVPDIPAPAMGDADRIEQVFVNILDNAIKYTEQGGKVTVSAELGENTIKIIVNDTGCGIAEEDLPRIKEKFYKANISVRGSGIGLAVADEIVKLHKGDLTIESVEGEGTTVYITLPIEPVLPEN